METAKRAASPKNDTSNHLPNPANPARAVAPPVTQAQQILQLQRLVGNQAVMRLLAENHGSLPVEISPIPIMLQRMFDEKDKGAPMTGQLIWKKYTPDKDKGAALLNYLAAQCGTPSQIDTAALTAKGGVLAKIATFLNGVFNAFSANSFNASTIIHGNGESRYTVDATRPERYAEMGITGTGQTRVVLDRLTSILYLSTHYEAPKVIRIAGAAPQGAITHIENTVLAIGYDPLV